MTRNYSAEEVLLLRDATELAVGLTGVVSEEERQEVARYVMMAFGSGDPCREKVARRAAQFFMIWNAGEMTNSR